MKSFETEYGAEELPESLFCSCAGKCDRKYGGTDAGRNNIYSGRNASGQSVCSSEGMRFRSRLPGTGNGLWFCHFNPIETFGAMEILGHMDQYGLRWQQPETAYF